LAYSSNSRRWIKLRCEVGALEHPVPIIDMNFHVSVGDFWIQGEIDVENGFRYRVAAQKPRISIRKQLVEGGIVHAKLDRQVPDVDHNFKRVRRYY
jgi:hypothetical protein